MPSITQEKLRRLALRSLTILSRHQDKGPMVTSYAHSIGISAPTYVEAIDAAQKAGSQRAQMVDGRNTAIDAFAATLRGWLPQLRRDVQGIASQGFGRGDKVAEDFFGDLQTIYSLIDVYLEQGGEPLAYLDDMKAELEVAKAQAEAANQASGGSRQTVGVLQAQAREAAQAFTEDLIAFRATLRVVLGKASPDYRALRAPEPGRTLEVIAAEGEAEGEAEASQAAALRIAEGGMADETVELGEDESDAEADEVSAAS